MINWTLSFLALIGLLLELNPMQVSDNSTWELSKTEDEIFVYTRKVDYSGFKEFKAEMEIKSTPEAIIDFLRDIDAYKNWLPDCADSKLLIKLSSREQMNYIVTDVPWPYEDRDFAYKFTIIETTENDTIKILIENQPDYVPLIKEMVRIPRSLGFWTIVPISDTKTKLIYQMHVEPGGYVPAWLANWKLVDIPYAFLFNLRELLVNK